MSARFLNGAVAAAAMMAACGWSAPTASAETARCVAARQLVQRHCSETAGTRLSAERCARARNWVREHCTGAARARPPGAKAKARRQAEPTLVAPPKRVRARERARADARKPAAALRAGPQVFYALARVKPAGYGAGIVPWQGWEASCCGVALRHHGVRYPGGSPHSDPGPHNNFEGGFNPAVLLKLHEAYGLGGQ